MKRVQEILQEYKNADITNESIQMYKEVKAIFEKEIKHTDKVERKYDEQVKVETHYKKMQKSCKEKMEKMKEEHPVKTTLAYLPFIGRFGETAKEYNRLRRKAKRIKVRLKMAKRNIKDLEPVCKKCQKQLKLNLKDLKACEKTLKRGYKLEKSNIELVGIFKNNESLLKRTYGDKSFKYIEEYVHKVRNGENDIELPRGIDNQKDLLKKIQSDLRKKVKGKEDIEPLLQEKTSNERNENENGSKNKTEAKNNNEQDKTLIFAQKELSIKQDFVGYKEKINGTVIKLTPVETLNYIGFISETQENLENYSSEELLNAIKKDKTYGFVDRGWDVLHEMIEDLKDENKTVDVNTLSESEKVVYGIAKKYIKKEENAIKQGKDEKGEQENQLA